MKEDRITVSHEADVSKARSAVREMALCLGFDEIRTKEIETAITELSTNLIKHRAINGRIILRSLNGTDIWTKGIEVASEDEGPGIQNIEHAMKEGVSTAGTLGAGLSGIRRLMDEFVIESEVGKGTAITARKWRSPPPRKIDFSVFSRRKPGEAVSGDKYFIKRYSDSVIFTIIDALGHGPEAHDVSLLALKVLEENYWGPLIRILELCHEKLTHTRGAAMALGRVDFRKNTFQHIGIGNVETRIYGAPNRVRPFCFNGTLGMIMESHRVIEYPYTDGMTMVMFSDGISGKFDLTSQSLLKTPQEIAAFIFKYFAKDLDDATVLVGR